MAKRGRKKWEEEAPAKKRKKTRIVYKDEIQTVLKREIMVLRKLLSWCMYNVTTEAKKQQQFEDCKEVMSGKNPFCKWDGKTLEYF